MLVVPMYATLVGGLVNAVVGNPIFIFAFGLGVQVRCYCLLIARFSMVASVSYYGCVAHFI